MRVVLISPGTGHLSQEGKYVFYSEHLYRNIYAFLLFITQEYKQTIFNNNIKPSVHLSFVTFEICNVAVLLYEAYVSSRIMSYAFILVGHLIRNATHFSSQCYTWADKVAVLHHYMPCHIT